MISLGSSVDLIVLAAGESKRLGRPKQLLPYQGKTLLQHVIDISALVSFENRILILGANSEMISNEVDSSGMKITINEAWAEGLSSSIKCGLATLLEINPKSQNVMFLLCDQPLLSLEIVSELVMKHLSKVDMITVSTYENQIGVPMIFSRPFYHELMTLEGDVGAKKIVKNHMDRTQSVPFEKGKFDIDTAEDYDKLLE